ncbi:myb-like protein L [Parasteatoda tepidariorum]|uniref:myb-like protein L n=1 Tax=Parasteatoda tepidariorum TaxID=114398 RepID=UPI0039BCDA23
MAKYSPADPAFDQIRKRIAEIKRKNRIICKTFGISALCKTSVEDAKDVYTKQKYEVFDERETSAVENCYKKALKLAEYYLNLRKIKKQRKLNSKIVSPQKDKHLDKYFIISPELEIGKKQKLKNIPLITPEINNSINDSFSSNGAIINNDKENCVTIEDGDISSLCSKRKKQKLQSCLSVLDSHSVKSNNKNSFQSSEKLPQTTESSCDNSTPILVSSSIPLKKRDNANSDIDIVYLETVNCSAHKKRNTPIRKQHKTKVISKRKLACTNHPIMNLKNVSKKNDSGRNNIQITRNQDINGELDESIHSDQPFTISNGSCALTRSGNVTTCLKNPSSDFVKSSITAKSYKIVENKGILNVKRTKFDYNKLSNIKRTNVQVIPELDLTEESEAIVDKPDLKEKADEVIITQFDLIKESNEIIPEIDLSGEYSEAMNINLTEDLNEVILPDIDLPKQSSEVINIDKTEKAGEVIIPQFDLARESNEKLPEIDLLSESGEAMNIDLTEDFDEVILPELDLTEEPVDFTIPKLHLTESSNNFSPDIEESLKSEGVVIRSGRWSKEEEDLLRRNFKDFQSRFGVYDAQLLLGIGGRVPSYKYEFQNFKKFLRVKHFYVRLGKDINERTLHSIYKKARDMFNQFKKMKDCTSSDVAAVILLQKKYGSNWSLIGQKLKIDGRVCYKIYMRNKKPYLKGKWSKSEVMKLISAIKSVENVSDLSTVNLKRISWDKVSELVPTRNANQCCSEWIYNQKSLKQNNRYGKMEDGERWIDV